MNDDFYIGIDLGGSHLSAVVFRRAECVWQQRLVTNFSRLLRADDPDGSRKMVMDTLVPLIEQARVQYPQCRAVGIGAPGFVDAATGRLLSSPNLPGLVDFDLGPEVAQGTGLPVVVENDAIAATWAEATYHTDTPRDMVFVGLGTGIGGGVVINGRPWRGVHGLAMEIGHLIVEAGGRHCGCGRRGCLETYASAPGVLHSYQRLGGDAADAEEVARFAGEGDQNAVESLAKAGRMLGLAAAHIVKVLDVSELVIGGGMSSAWGWLKPEFDRMLIDNLPTVFHDQLYVRMSAHGSKAGMIGAAQLAARVHHG